MSSDTLMTKCEKKRIAKNCCNTKLHTKECSFSWTIGNYSRVIQRRDHTIKSSQFSAVGDDLKWYLEHSVNYSCEWKNYCSSVALRVLGCHDNCARIIGSAEISLMKPDGHKIETQNSDMNVTPTETPDTISSLRITVVQMKKWTFQDELTIFCNCSYWEADDIVTTSSQDPNLLEISESSLSQDFERCYLDERFSDVTVSVKGKNYPVHKIILATRSSVFNAMFANKMQESQNNNIVIPDIDRETFEEILHYIYTGKTTNLDESASELLPAADKYDLRELKAMCEDALYRKLSTDNAAKVLILADMHHADELKTLTLRFIKENYASCEDFKNSEIWTVLTSTSHLHLIKDMLAAFCEK